MPELKDKIVKEEDMPEQNYPEDSRYPPILYHPQDSKDLIDFPCSPTWQNYYHEFGLTPRHVEEPRVEQEAETPQELVKLAEDMSGIRLDCEHMRKEIWRLKKSAEELKPPTTKGFKPVEQT